MRSVFVFFTLVSFAVAGVSLATYAQQGAGDAPQAKTPSLVQLEEAFAHAADRIAPSIVSLEVEREPAKPQGNEPAYAQRPAGPVSGLAVGPDRVLTSAFNVEDAKRVVVALPDGRRLEARALGRDETLDLALFAVEGADAGAGAETGEPLRPVRLPEGAPPPPPPIVGSWLIAVGRGQAGSPVVNAGIVSALGRFRGDAIQTDAALNYGNYGGAVVDIEGRLVGVPVRLSARTGINSGVGFVIPAARLRDVLPLLERGEVRRAPRSAFLGVQFGREIVDPPGVEIARIVENTAAADAGLEKGDIIRRIGDVEAVDTVAVSDVIQARRPGDSLRLQVARAGHGISFEVTLRERPAGK